MRILFIGDVMGESGQEMFEKTVPLLKRNLHPQLTIANGENATRGRGINEKVFKKLQKAGADVITMGNHTWDNREIQDFIGTAKKLIRPANFSAGQVPGIGYTIVKVNSVSVGVLNVQGRVFMSPSDDPFAVGEKIIAQLEKETSIIFVDFHGEATSEKEAFAWNFDGRVSAVVGTHTHVQTNDARILPQGTAFLSDVGMTGPYDGILGMRRESVIGRFKNQLPTRFEVETSGGQTLGAVVIDVDEKTGRAQKISNLRIDPDHPYFE
ncbi:metallophosphoesterase [Ligilactobacillus salitolerans]|uniref:Metallophosphoesterase n=1 Tax=Ligilactobacillus salitolerans TaxID=1808352 RepID=A0A401ISS9_9LACO|nr:TIGR00282 family metallophosphoesterase [Ligilactobacillus salitolerans]GBG94592.1 metallophosphoesterase [Ligilactobacillus salitolerans]